MKQKIKNIVSIFIPLIGGSIIGLIISNSIDYNNLTKPPLSPPKAIFPVAWTIIYLLLGVSYYLVLKTDSNYEDKGLYYRSLIINYLWSIIFFVLKWRFISIVWIILLGITVIRLIKSFKKYNVVAAYLQIPYLLWLIFATYLNIGIYILN